MVNHPRLNTRSGARELTPVGSHRCNRSLERIRVPAASLPVLPLHAPKSTDEPHPRSKEQAASGLSASRLLWITVHITCTCKRFASGVLRSKLHAGDVWLMTSRSVESKSYNTPIASSTRLRDYLLSSKTPHINNFPGRNNLSLRGLYRA